VAYIQAASSGEKKKKRNKGMGNWAWGTSPPSNPQVGLCVVVGRTVRRHTVYCTVLYCTDTACSYYSYYCNHQELLYRVADTLFDVRGLGTLGSSAANSMARDVEAIPIPAPPSGFISGVIHGSSSGGSSSGGSGGSGGSGSGSSSSSSSAGSAVTGCSGRKGEERMRIDHATEWDLYVAHSMPMCGVALVR
jgi:hypothetical protein